MTKKICPMCKGLIDTTGKYCQKCYNYLYNHPEGLYPLPSKGSIYYAPNGDPICHICGKAMRKLGSHIALAHKITQQEYRERFGLYHNTKLANSDYQDTMRKYNKQYSEIVVKDNLLKNGINTRVGFVNIPRRKLGYKIQTQMVSTKY